MDDRLYYVSFAVLLVAISVVIPFFLKAEQPKPCRKSLYLKQTCSTIFLINALAAGLVGDFTRYAAFMFVGLCFSWLGDFLLHVRPGSGFFVAGLSSFLVGHVFYSIAYCKAAKTLFPTVPLFTIIELVIYIALIAAALLSSIFITKISFGKLLVPCILYTATISAMAVKGFHLAIMIMKSGSLINAPILTGILLMLGAFLFMLSDYTLSVLTFKKDVKKHGALRQVNIWTYFYAQMFLGATIFFISA